MDRDILPPPSQPMWTCGPAIDPHRVADLEKRLADAEARIAKLEMHATGATNAKLFRTLAK